MQEPKCPHCQTPKSQWRLNYRQGYPIKDDIYCSPDCSAGAGQSRGRGSAIGDGMARVCAALPDEN
jgi:hypothetical protein